jgi:hypothetical protein
MFQQDKLIIKPYLLMTRRLTIFVFMILIPLRGEKDVAQLCKRPEIALNLFWDLRASSHRSDLFFSSLEGIVSAPRTPAEIWIEQPQPKSMMLFNGHSKKHFGLFSNLFKHFATTSIISICC